MGNRKFSDGPVGYKTIKNITLYNIFFGMLLLTVLVFCDNIREPNIVVDFFFFLNMFRSYLIVSTYIYNVLLVLNLFGIRARNTQNCPQQH